MSPVSLTIGGYGPEESAHGSGLGAFRDSLVAACDGSVTVEVVWNIMDHGRPNTDLLDLVESGEFFMCYFSTSYLGERVPELNVLETPFLFSGLEKAHRCLDGELGTRLGEAIRARTRFEALGFWDNGFRHLTNRLRPVHGPDDLAGMTVRVQPNPVHEELIRSWGATPVATELSEGIDLIVSGRVDAQENPLANTVAYGVDRVHPHVTMTGHLYGARGLFANRDVYDGLPEGIRRHVDEAARHAVEVQRTAANRLESELRDEMQNGGSEFIEPTHDRRRQFEEAVGAAIDMARAMVPADLFEAVKG